MTAVKLVVLRVVQKVEMTADMMVLMLVVSKVA